MTNHVGPIYTALYPGFRNFLLQESQTACTGVTPTNGKQEKWKETHAFNDNRTL